jgi:hypothetical protein
MSSLSLPLFQLGLWMGRLIYAVRTDGDVCLPFSFEEVLPSLVCVVQANPNWILVAREEVQHKVMQGG